MEMSAVVALERDGALRETGMKNYHMESAEPNPTAEPKYSRTCISLM
jgi:hypothetical protein